MNDSELMVKREGEFTYPIVFRTDFSDLAEEIKKADIQGSSACIISDSNVAPLYADQVREELEKIFDRVSIFVIPAGEENKHLGTVTDIYRFLIEEGMDRKGVLAALGGGVVGDITGFAAATYLRGIRFIQIPTTLLAQVDSSVGGKTGVDLDQYKNMVGAFHQPSLVYMNMKTIRTLPEVEFVCGMGEVLKTGLICDGGFFRRTVSESGSLSPNADPALLAGIVRRCCEIKAGIVERDPKEQGERALLNLGHTAGHAIEKLKDFSLKHGQCVGAGTAVAAALSLNRGRLTPDEYREILDGLSSCGLPITVSGLAPEDILSATKKDKKMDSGRIRFILMDGVGSSYIDRTVTDEELLDAIRTVAV